MLLSRFFFNMQSGKNERNVKVHYQDDIGTKLKLYIGYTIMVNSNCWVLLSNDSAVIHQIYWMAFQINFLKSLKIQVDNYRPKYILSLSHTEN